MKICASCNINSIPSWKVIDGKNRNLKNRKYCFKCSPFGKHNTSSLEKEKRSDYSYQKERGFKRKCKLALFKGGSCSKCGYDKNLAALEFHHKNPSEKESRLDVRILTNRKWDFILKEAEKCELICSNCHAEHHHPSWENWKMSQAGIEPTLDL